MLFQKRFLLPFGFLLASALSAQTVTLLNDSFTSAATAPFKTTNTTIVTPGVGKQNPPTSAEWFGIGSNSITGTGTYAENYIKGVGISDPGASASQGVIAYFEAPGAQRQINVGDTLTAAVNFTYNTATPATGASTIRIGLLNSNSTGNGANGTNNYQTTVEQGTTNGGTGTASLALNYSGYYAEFDPADSTATTASILYERPVGATTNWVGSNGGFLPNAAGLVQRSNNAILPNPQVSGGDTYQALITLTYTSATVMTFTFDVYDTTGGGFAEVPGYFVTTTAGSGSANPTAPVVSAFDGISFGGACGSLTITNVTIIHFVLPTAQPTFSSAAGTFTGGSVTSASAQTVTISSATSGASIAYTIGSNNTPTESGGVITNGTSLANGGTVQINATTVLKAIAFTAGSSSVETDVKYTITGTTAAPSFSPGTGTYTSAQSVNVVDDTPGATIYYTTDGSTPTTGSATVASGSSVTISAPTPNPNNPDVLQAFATSTGNAQSTLSSASYTLPPYAPVILDQPPAGQPVTDGSTVTFDANAAGFPGSVTYQWQISTNGGTSWTNLTNGGQYSGTATSTLTISGVNAALAANEYRYVATDSTGSTDSNAFAFVPILAWFSQPDCIAVDSSGNLFVGDSNYNTIQELTPVADEAPNSYFVYPVAGSQGSAGSTDGTAANALFRQPGGITINSSTETLYVADTANSTIRQIAPGDIVTTLAGSVSNQSWQDGTGAAAYFSVPHGIALDLSGNLYVADSQNDVIRKIAPGAIVTTFAGTEGVAGSGNTPAKFSDPFGVAVDTTTGNTFSGTIYVADTGNDTIRAITPAGVVSTLAGNVGISIPYSDGTASATFNGPQGLAVDGSGNIYVADTGNSTIREITPAGVVTTLAGIGGLKGLEDGNGLYALFNKPTAVAVDSQNNVYVADTGNAAIRKITQSTGGVTVTTLVFGPPPTPPGGGTPGKTIGDIIPSSTASDGGGGAMDGWFLGALAALGILRWRRARR